MSAGNLCWFTVLATLVAFPAVRKLEVEVKQADPRTANVHKIERPPAVFLTVQSRNPRDLGTGKLLVASRELADPNFAETVVLLVHYDAQGVVGLILNRRTDVPLSRVFEDLKPAKERSDRVYLGGPVETPLVLALFQSTSKIDQAEHIFGEVYLISGKALFEETISAKPDPGVFHVYVGYAGWTAISCGKKSSWGHGSFSRRTPARFSTRIRILCG